MGISELRAGFYTPGARLTFGKLSQAFSTIPILHYCDSQCDVWIKTAA